MSISFDFFDRNVTSATTGIMSILGIISNMINECDEPKGEIEN